MMRKGRLSFGSKKLGLHHHLTITISPSPSHHHHLTITISLNREFSYAGPGTALRGVLTIHCTATAIGRQQ